MLMGNERVSQFEKLNYFYCKKTHMFHHNELRSWKTVNNSYCLHKTQK